MIVFQIFAAWGLFMPYVFVLGVCRILTDVVYRAFTKGEM